jgi:hypothetical protein
MSIATTLPGSSMLLADIGQVPVQQVQVKYLVLKKYNLDFTD